LIRKSFYLIILLVFGLVGVKALFHNGYYTSHDGWHQVARLYHFDDSIRQGQFPPQWAGKLLHGAGYPLFFFSYSLPWYFAEPLVVSGVTVFDAIKMIYIIGYVLSGITMFFWIRAMWGEKSGLISAILYLWAPYRFSNIFVRGSLGEATCFVFLPLIFWSFYGLSRQMGKPYIILGSISIASVILSHAMIVFLLVIPSILYLVALLKMTPNAKKFIQNSISVFFLAAVISAYYLLPAISYKSITNFRNIFVDLYKDHFVTLSKLFYSKWGYGFSNMGTDAMSVQLGMAQWVTIALSILFFLLSFNRFRQNKKEEKRLDSIAMAFLGGFFFSLFMMLKQSSSVWEFTQKIFIIDFPWRFLSVATFLSSALSGWIITFLKPSYLKNSCIFALVIITLFTNRNHLRVNEYTFIPLDLYVASEQTSNTYDEYLPSWADKSYFMKENRDFLQSSEEELDKKITMLKNASSIKIFTYAFDHESHASVDLLYFPGWKVMIDKNEKNYTRDGLGRISLYLPKGEHTVSIEYAGTLLMAIGKIISVSGIMYVGWFYFNLIKVHLRYKKS